MKPLVALTFAIFFLAVSLPVRSELREMRQLHYQMGTILDITLWHSDPDEAKKILRRSVQEVHRLEGILSHYDPQSSLSLFNSQAGKGKIKIDRELFRLLALATDLSLRTSGYFDVTVGPLVSLWEQAGEKGIIPAQQLLSRTLNLVGFQKLKLYKTGEAELVNKGMKIDPGGIGKGFAVDRIIEILREAGVKSALINFGGSSIYALGGPPGEKGWTIGIEGTDDRLVGAIRLRDQALSTSRSMGRSWEIEGRRFGHLINPKSGIPVKEPRSATAIAASATEAEALTKPIVLLGRRGMALTKNFPQTTSLLISEDGEIHLSDGFVSATHFKKLKDR
jgi:thiamine biosynthesis lipoprotein